MGEQSNAGDEQRVEQEQPEKPRTEQQERPKDLDATERAADVKGGCFRFTG